MSNVYEVRTRVDERAMLDTLARHLVEERLAACVHVRGPETSIYRWKGDVVVDDEWELTALTSPGRVEALVAALEAAHPYDLPSVVTTTAGYAEWVQDETHHR